MALLVRSLKIQERYNSTLLQTYPDYRKIKNTQNCSMKVDITLITWSIEKDNTERRIITTDVTTIYKYHQTKSRIIENVREVLFIPGL